MADENVLVSFRAEDQLTSVLKGLESSFASLTKSIQSLESSVAKSFKNQSKEVSDANKTIQSEVKKTEGSFLSLKSIINTALGVSLSSVLAGAVNGIRNFGSEALNMTAKLEQTRIGFEVLTGSADLARSTLKDLSDYAKSTPFELPQLQDTAIRLKAVGFATKDLLPVIDVLGNISAGVGTQKLPLLALALSQVKNAGKLTGAELRQFSENGVPLLDLLAERMGKTTGELRKMIENGEVGFNDVYAVLDKLTSKGGQFSGLMEAQSKSFSGVVSNMKDQIGVLSRSFMGITEEGDIIAGGFFDKIKQSAESMMIVLNNLGYLLNGQLNFEQFLQFSGVSDQVIGAIQAVGSAFQWLGGMITQVFQSDLAQGLVVGVAVGNMIFGLLIPAVTGLATAIGATLGGALTFLMSPLGLVISGVALLFTAWQTNFLGIRDVTQNVLQWVGGKFGEFGQFMLTNLDGVTNGVFAFSNGFIEAFNAITKFIVVNFFPILSELSSFFGTTFSSLTTIATESFAFIVEQAGRFARAMGDPITAVLTNLITTFGNVFTNIVKIVQGATKFISGIFSLDWKKMVEGAIDMLAGFAGGIASIWDGINSLFSQAISSLMNEVLKATENDLVQKGLELIGLGGAREGIRKSLEEMKKTQTTYQDAVKGLASGAKAMLGIQQSPEGGDATAITNTINGLVTGIKDGIKSFDFDGLAKSIKAGGSKLSEFFSSMGKQGQESLLAMAKNPPEIAKLGEEQKNVIKSLIQTLGQGAVGFGASLSQVQTGAITMPDFGALFGGLSGQAKAYTPDGQASIQDKLQAQKKSTLEDFLKQAGSGATGKAGSGSKGKSPVETEIENQKKVLQLQEKQLQLTKQNLQAQQDSAQTQIQNEITNSQNQLNSLKLQKEAKTITDEEFDKQELALKTNLENKKQSLDKLKQEQSSQIDQLEAKALELNKKQLDLDIKQFGSDISGQTGDKNLVINGVNINNTSDLDQFSQLLKNALA